VACEESGIGANGDRCEMCDGNGYLRIDGCPRKVIGWEMTQTINLAGYATKGFLPVNGGILDQSSWFVDVWSTLENDQAKIDQERSERRNRG